MAVPCQCRVLKVKLAMPSSAFPIHLLKTFINAEPTVDDRVITPRWASYRVPCPAIAIAWTDKLILDAAGDEQASTTERRSPHDRHPQEDLIQSVADAFQYISYHHPARFTSAPWARPMSARSPRRQGRHRADPDQPAHGAEGHRPICQDTGIGMVFLKVGMQVTWPDATMSLQQMIDEGVRRAYANLDNRCAPRCSPTRPAPAGTLRTTRRRWSISNRPGDHVEVICAKGGGSKPSPSLPCSTSDDLVDWVLHKIPRWALAGARRASSVSASAARRKAMLLAKESTGGAGGHPGTEGARRQDHGPRNCARTLREDQRLGVGARVWAASPRSST